MLNILASFACLALAPATQGPGEISFVETSVDLRRDGSAVVLYTVQWSVVRGEFHGFYFEGNDRLAVRMAAAEAYAVDDRGQRYDLSISLVSEGRWDIVLAGGLGVSAGRQLTFVFAFATNFVDAGYVAPTTAEDGRRLAVFNWSPVEWNEARNQDHYTLSVLTPHVLQSGLDARQYVTENELVLTEPWVNEKFRIDYQRGEADRLRLVFHRDRPGNNSRSGWQWASRTPAAAGARSRDAWTSSGSRGSSSSTTRSSPWAAAS